MATMRNPVKKLAATSIGAVLLLAGCGIPLESDQSPSMEQESESSPDYTDGASEDVEDLTEEDAENEEDTQEAPDVSDEEADASAEESNNEPVENIVPDDGGDYALDYLDDLLISEERIGGYERSEFGSGWSSAGGCDMRNRILDRDMNNVSKEDNDCIVLSGTLDDPFTGEVINFQRDSTGGGVDIDHVVALSDAWQTGAANFTYEQRVDFSNDPLNLLAVKDSANREKSDSSADDWLPVADFQCEFASMQVAVKHKYDLWVTSAEHAALETVLQTCPTQALHSSY